MAWCRCPPDTARGFIPMMGADRPREGATRLNKEKGQGREGTGHARENQLANPKFVERAPAAWWKRSAQSANSQSKLANIEQSIAPAS